MVLYGMLLPAGRITRIFSCKCSPDYWPVAFSPQPGAHIEMASQSDTEVTIVNKGQMPAAYMVVFIEPSTMRQFAEARNVFNSLRGLYGAFKAKPPTN